MPPDPQRSTCQKPLVRDVRSSTTTMMAGSISTSLTAESPISLRPLNLCATLCTGTTTMAHSRMSPRKRASVRVGLAWASPRLTMTMMDSQTFI